MPKIVDGVELEEWEFDYDVFHKIREVECVEYDELEEIGEFLNENSKSISKKNKRNS